MCPETSSGAVPPNQDGILSSTHAGVRIVANGWRKYPDGNRAFWFLGQCRNWL